MNDRKLYVKCARCGEIKTGYPAKGLCWGCWYTPGVRVPEAKPVKEDPKPLDVPEQVAETVPAESVTLPTKDETGSVSSYRVIKGKSRRWSYHEGRPQL